MDDNALKFLSSTPTNSVKFSLYLKTHELKEISKLLENVLLLPEKKRKAWAKEHGEIINRAIDTFVQESNTTLSELTFDEETLALSKELIISLRDTVDMIHGILFESRKLTS
jgi:hypothetical protein